MSIRIMLGAAAAAVAAALLMSAPAQAQQKLDFILNWVPGGDHVPYYYAKKMGWYEKEGIDLYIEPGKGSALATQKVGAGANPIGLADMAGVLVAKGKGADTVAVFNVYANSPQGMYWLKSSGINGIKDLAGKKIGNPAGDGARVMWPALAKANGIDPKSVTWVNIDANAKLAALEVQGDRRDHVVLQHPPHLPARTRRRHGLPGLARRGPESLRQLDHRQRQVPGGRTSRSSTSSSRSRSAPSPPASRMPSRACRR